MKGGYSIVVNLDYKDIVVIKQLLRREIRYLRKEQKEYDDTLIGNINKKYYDDRIDEILEILNKLD